MEAEKDNNNNNKYCFTELCLTFAFVFSGVCLNNYFIISIEQYNLNERNLIC